MRPLRYRYEAIGEQCENAFNPISRCIDGASAKVRCERSEHSRARYQSLSWRYDASGVRDRRTEMSLRSDRRAGELCDSEGSEPGTPLSSCTPPHARKKKKEKADAPLSTQPPRSQARAIEDVTGGHADVTSASLRDKCQAETS